MTSFRSYGSNDCAYMRLYRSLRDDIAAGAYPPGSRLPSKRTLAARTGLSVITVEHALALLVDEGWAEARERSGTYALSRGGVSVRRAALSEMSLPPAPPEDFPFGALARIMRRTLSDKGELILAKSPPCGLRELRSAICEYLARSRSLAVSEEQIVVGSGAEYLYSLSLQLLGRERLYALEDPCWEKIRRVYEVNGAKTVSLPLLPSGIDGAALASCSAEVLHVTPYHSFPSGVTASAEKRREYARWARARGAWIIEDDYDSELASRGERIETVFSLLSERVIYVSTFSKTIAPSFRAGYMVLPEQLCEEYERTLGFYSCSVPVYDQYVLAEFCAAASSSAM